MDLYNTENEIKSWLKTILKEDVEDNYSLKILGSSEKGDGYVSDIIFVSLIPTNGYSGKEYNLVLKCSKRSQVLRQKVPIKESFLNEMYIYDTVLPAFVQFQLEKGIKASFDSIPKYYGEFRDTNTEVIVFENLKTAGYILWDKKKPLTRKHIDMVVSEYAKFHAISIAMNEEEPQKFEELAKGVEDVFKKFMQTSGTNDMFGSFIEEIYNLLKNDLDEEVLGTWRKLKEEFKYIFQDMVEQVSGLKVILHGDCWNNNHMFKHMESNPNVPIKHALLDWQLSRYSSPVLDLSYHLFTCISEEDIENLDDILTFYYERLMQFLKEFGLSYSAKYPFETFWQDWRNYSRFGILMATAILNICFTEKDEVVDMATTVESGETFAKAFTSDIKDKLGMKNRSKYIVKYAVENCLI